MRVLHLIDAMAAWGGPCTQRLAADAIARLSGGHADHAHEVLLIGRRADAYAAAACGLGVCGTIWPLAGRTLAARASLVRWLRAQDRAGCAADVIHSWTSSCGALAAVAAPHVPRVVTPRPLAVDPDSPHLAPRDEVRRRWLRDEGIRPDEFVLGLLGEPPERFDARQAMHVGARSGLSSRRIRMIMSGRAFERAASQRFLAQLDLDRVIVQDESLERPWEMLRGLDVALLLAPVPARRGTGSSLSALPLLWAWSAGVPVIAEATAPLEGLLTHDHNGLVFPAGDLNAGCDRLARLHDDPALAQRLSAAGRAAVTQRFHIATLCGRVLDAWQAAIEQGRAHYLDHGGDDLAGDQPQASAASGA